MTSEIVERGGRLFVLDPWENDFSKPVRYRLAWPTGLIAANYRHWVGDSVTSVGGGVYRLKVGLCFRLENGERTRPCPVHTEEAAIPKPRGKKEYRNGAWR